MTGNALRKLVQSKLTTLCSQLYQAGTVQTLSKVYYRLADADKIYPHIVFSISLTRKYDFSRDDVTIDVDIWAKDEKDLQNITDAVEALFNNINDPQNNFLPTFFVESIKEVENADKDIRHMVVEITAQNYERS